MLALAVVALNAVVPPLLVTFAVFPAVPLVWSHARKVMPLVTVPLKFAFGTKRTEVFASAASSRPTDADGEPNAVHVDPPLVVYCQVPFVLTTAVTAIPEAAPASASNTLP